MPVAQTQVLRRVLKGGISANSGCRFFPVLSTVPSFVGVPGRVLVGVGGLVFGTLLGPEATGPWVLPPFCGGGVAGLFVSGFLAAPITWLFLLWRVRVWGVWYGVVV